METGDNLPRILLKNVTFSDGSIVDLVDNQILVIVGSNNSGKSATLEEIYKVSQFEHLPLEKNKVVKDVEFSRKGTTSDLFKFIMKNTFIKPETGNVRQLNVNFDNSSTQARAVDISILTNRWNETGKLLYDFSLFFINHLSTSRRLWVSAPAPSINIYQDGPYHPVHFLLESDEGEAVFAKYFKLAFNKDIIVKRSPGPKIVMYVGDKPEKTDVEDRSSPSYIKKLVSLPTLDMQGDGMKGFVGVMLSAFTSIQSVLLIDEPEAFLHPPQARLLGRMLAKEIPSDKQIIISTHSEDILKGLIDVNSPRLKIIRLERKEEVNYVKTLGYEDIKLLWSDPILRYSSILSGLFHSKVILCEGDADCRFYSAINDTFSENEDVTIQNNFNYSDSLFVHCGGKDKMYIVVKALKKLGVPIAVAADIDILRTEGNLKRLVDAFNGDWEIIKLNYKIFQSSIEKQKVEKSLSAIKIEINKIIDESESENLSSSNIELIQNTIKKASPWETLKRAGKANLQPGQEYKAFEDIVSYLKAIGLHIVEVGELERFVRSVGNKGPKWVNQVLIEKDFKKDSELDEAKSFVKQLVS